MSNELTVSQEVTPSAMLMKAVENGADLVQIEKFMDLQDRWEKREAQKLFAEAMALFQSKLEPIVKKREAHNSKYADIDDIARSIRPLLTEAGLSYQFSQFQDQSSITVSCIVSHVAGHSVTTSFTAPHDTSGGKNSIQAMASTVTYLRRYTLTGALGITTGNDDSDGGRPAITVEDLLNYNQVVREEFFSIASIKNSLLHEDYSSAKESLSEISNDTMKELWRAPSKGGIFTTKSERK